MHFSVGIRSSYSNTGHSLLKEERKNFIKGFAKVGTHECIYNGIDGRIGVGHAVGPYLHLISVVITFESGTKCLKKDIELNGTPTDSEEKYNNSHHA